MAGHNARPLRFITLETGCFVCLTHKLNADGYFRKRWADGFEMFHRFIYRAHKGEIPEGYEVDHICHVRACCNPEHLQAIPGEQHAVETNTGRYADRKAKAKALWLKARMSGTALARQLGVSFSITCRWIREWKAE